ncbi:MAG: amidohydrolase family protein [Patescibacteria group bacterium]
MVSSVLIKNVNIIPMPGSRVLHGYNMVIEGARIKRIFPSRKQETDKFAGRIINGKGKFLIPGLFDMHVHLHSQTWLSLFLRYGITAIRETGSYKKEIFSLRDKVNSGKVLGPRMYICGPILEGDPPFWKGFRIVRNKKEGRIAVSELKRQGVDFIKVYQTLKPEVYEAILKEACKRGLKVTGHLPKSISIMKAIKMGQGGFEHMSSMRNYISKIVSVNANLKNYPGWRKFVDVKIDKRKLEKLGSLLERNNVFLCPTLVVDKKMSQLADYSKLKQSKEARLLPKYYREIKWNPNHPKSSANIKGRPPLWWENFCLYCERTRHILPFLQKHSNILAGSDTPNPFVIPGVSLLEELELLVDSGLKSYQALEAATYNAALSLDALLDFGTIEEGKIANLVLLRKNPLKNISNIRSIKGVILNGTYLFYKDLRKKAKGFT